MISLTEIDGLPIITLGSLHFLRAESQENLPSDLLRPGGGILSKKNIKNRGKGLGMIGKSRALMVYWAYSFV